MYKWENPSVLLILYTVIITQYEESYKTQL